MKERIITAVVLLATVLPLIYLGGYFFIGLGIVATTIAAWEMISMHDNLTKVPIWVKLLVITATLGIVFAPTLLLILLIMGGYLLLLIFTCYVLKKIDFKTVSFCIEALIYLGFSFRALLEIRNHGLMLFIFLVATVILTDSGAYFTGKFFGKNKLAPKISPNKTVEGAIGGWLIGGSFALAYGLANNLFIQTWILVVLASGLPILSQIGDLVASAMKRKYGIKDYGKIFPGHGGVMDRVDSQLLAGILLYVVLYFGGLGGR